MENSELLALRSTFEEKFKHMESLIRQKDGQLSEALAAKNTLLQSISDKDSQILSLKTERNKYNADYANLKKAKAELQYQQLLLEQEKKRIKDDFSLRSTALYKERKAAAELGASLKSLEAKNISLGNDLKQAKDDLRIAQAQAEIFQNRAEALEASVGKIHTLGASGNQQLDSLMRSLNETIQELEQTKLQLKKLAWQEENVKRELKKTRTSQREEAERLFKEKQELLENKREISQELMQVKAEKASLENIIGKLQSDQQELANNAEKEIQELRSSLDSYSFQNEELAKELAGKNQEIIDLKAEVANYRDKEYQFQKTIDEKYQMYIPDRMDIEAIYDKYVALMDAYDMFAKKYEEEKKVTSELQYQTMSLQREVESQKSLAEAHKKAYNELIMALTPHIRAGAESLLAKPQFKVEGLADYAEMQEQLERTAIENDQVKARMKLLIQTNEVNAAKLQSHYEDELARKDAYNAQLINKVQELVKTVNDSERFYTTFSGNASQLMQYIDEFSKTQHRMHVFEANGETKENSIELVQLKETLSRKKSKIGRIKDELKFFKKRNEEFQAQIHSLEEELKLERTQTATLAKTIEKASTSGTEAQLKQKLEENATLKGKVTTLDAELNKSREIEKAYQDQILLLKDELCRMTQVFSKLEDDLIKTGTLHKKMLDDFAEKTKDSGDQMQDVEAKSENEEIIIWRLRSENLKIVNDSLKEKVVELTEKVKVCEGIFEKFDLQFSALFEGKPIAGSLVIDQKKLEELEQIAEEYKKAETHKLRSNVELHLKLEEKEKQVETLSNQIKDLKEIIEKQEISHSALMKANENVVSDMHKQFEAYHEATVKETEHLKKLLLDTRIQKDIEIANIKSNTEKVSEEHAGLRLKLEEAQNLLNETKSQYESRLKMFEDLKSQYESVVKRNKEIALIKEDNREQEKVAELQLKFQNAQSELEIKQEQNMSFQSQLQIHKEMLEKLKSALQTNEKEFKEREQSLLKRIDGLETALKQLSVFEVTGKEPATQGQERIQTEQMRGELLVLRNENKKLNEENYKLNQEITRLNAMLNKQKETITDLEKALKTLEELRKENAELTEQVMKIHGQNSMLRKLENENGKELAVARLKLREMVFQLKTVSEKPVPVEAKDSVNPMMRKLLELMRKAKNVIVARNAAIEFLQRENDYLRGELEAKGTEEMVVHKKKKIE